MSTTKARLNFKESIKSNFKSDNTNIDQVNETKMLPSTKTNQMNIDMRNAMDFRYMQPMGHINASYLAALNQYQNYQRFQQQQQQQQQQQPQQTFLTPRFEIKKTKANETNPTTPQQSEYFHIFPQFLKNYTKNWPTNNSLCSSSLSDSPSPTPSASSANYYQQLDQTTGLLNYNHANHIFRPCFNANNQYSVSRTADMLSNDVDHAERQSNKPYYKIEDDLDDDNLDNVDDGENTEDEDQDDDDDMTKTTNSSESRLKFRKQNRKRHHDGGHLYCCVCGANANGYNFNAVTCESCKAFFRRNAFRDLSSFRCANSDRCDINVSTRKKCKKCRIRKCFDEGMNKDWIMNDAERANKRLKIQKNRMLKAMKMQQFKSNLTGEEIVDGSDADLNNVILKNEV
jgi:hypothetical protein